MEAALTHRDAPVAAWRQLQQDQVDLGSVANRPCLRHRSGRRFPKSPTPANN